jgi:hypothetical protein
MKGLTSAIIIIAILVFLLLGASQVSPYSGKYSCEVNNNITLELNKNNKFILINTLGKNAEYAYGEYSVKDNEILLIPNNDYSYFYGNKNIKGKVEGTRISFLDFTNKNNLIFNKQ